MNGKTYVGKHQTGNLDDDYLGSGKLIRAAIKKYGRENFRKEILHVFETEAEMNTKEAELVTIDTNTYNLCPGGQGGFGYINLNGLCDYSSAASKSNTSLAGKVKSSLGGKAAYKKHGASNHGVTFRGKKHSEETKEKLRLSHSSLSHPRGPRGPYKKQRI